ncbi:MAG: hypothetical protein M3T56_00735 [Chloroflexota bacterium]|nr:hypothetical protein [Chloroflexota bacterium]
MGPCAATATTPLGALPPARPAWCFALGEGLDTAVKGANTWVDGFGTAQQNARLAASYRIFEAPRAEHSSVFRTQHFAHNGHWMVDVAGYGQPSGIYEGSAEDFFVGPNNGGGLMRPNAGFRFDHGALVIEFDVSAGMSVYGDRAWPEIVVTTAVAPSPHETNGWYAAGLFGGDATIGCSFPSDRLSECRIYDRDKITANLSEHFSAGATTTFGGAPTGTLATVWHQCGASDPDDRCRDRFRLVLERDAITIYVNGVLYMEHRGLPIASQLPVALLQSPVYVYFASWAYLVEPTVTRFHWSRIAINP